MDVNLSMTFRILAIGMFAAVLFAADDSGIAGSWTGESLCTGVRGACKDEHVIWTFKAPDSSGKVWASADKVVDGQRINMGSAEFQFDKPASTLSWKIPLGIWKLVLKKDAIDGTLTLKEGGIARRMTLKKDTP
jgi:hypothetical protein